MTRRFTVTRKFEIERGRRGLKTITMPNCDRQLAPPVPRISKLMALAIRFDQLIQDDVVADQAELARLGHVGRARLTQIMNLLTLAPEIQESLLDLTSSPGGRAQISERSLRQVLAAIDWKKQRRRWRTLATKLGASKASAKEVLEGPTEK